MTDQQSVGILFYEGSFYMFSNFSSFGFNWNGEFWMTAEHAYQAAKFADPNIRRIIRMASSAHNAKKIAKAFEGAVRPTWPSVRLSVMEEILREKLAQHPFIQKKLLKTGFAPIVEDSPVDPFWGRGPGHDGENHLGKIWMKLRDELRKQQAENATRLRMWSECHCMCHAPDGSLRAEHVMACCVRCPWCNMNVVGDIEAHIKDEHPDYVGKEPPLINLSEILFMSR